MNIKVDLFQSWKEVHSERLLGEFMQNTGLDPSATDFYIMLEAYLEAEYYKDTSPMWGAKTLKQTELDFFGEEEKEVAKEEDVAVVDKATGKDTIAIVLFSGSSIAWVLVNDVYLSIEEQQLTDDMLFDFVEKGIMTAETAKKLRKENAKPKTSKS